MNDETREALEGSIKKWEEIIAGTTHDKGQDNCPLCQLFYERQYGECDGCPVYIKTGNEEACGGSPYDAYCNHTDDCEVCEPHTGGMNHCNQGKRLAEEERDFLISLRGLDNEIGEHDGGE